MEHNGQADVEGAFRQRRLLGKQMETNVEVTSAGVEVGSVLLMEKAHIEERYGCMGVDVVLVALVGTRLVVVVTVVLMVLLLTGRCFHHTLGQIDCDW